MIPVAEHLASTSKRDDWSSRAANQAPMDLVVGTSPVTILRKS